MKKLIILVLLLSTTFVYSKDKGPGFYVELGKDRLEDIAYTDIQVHYVFKFWNIEFMPYGGIKTWFDSEGLNINGGGIPYNDTYKVGAELTYEGVTFGFQHYCSHPVANKGFETEEGKRYVIEDGMMGTKADYIYVRYSFN